MKRRTRIYYTRGQEKRQTMNHPQSILTNVLHPLVELTARSGRGKIHVLIIYESETV